MSQECASLKVRKWGAPSYQTENAIALNGVTTYLTYGWSAHAVRDLTNAALYMGGSNAYTGVSTSRTLMLAELVTLLAATSPDATKGDYRRAVIDDNVLLKPSASTQSKSYSYLRDRFALDPEVSIFAALRLLWERDQPGQPLMALLVALFRDPVLRSSTELVIDRATDQTITSREFSECIDLAFPNRLTEKTLKSTGENTTSTFKQSGHLSKKNPSTRQRVNATPGAVTMALLIAYLNGAQGMAFLDTDWVRLLDSSDEKILTEARTASNRGWLEIRHAGNVLEVTFRTLLDAIGVQQ